jgi:hypothetical protein
MERVGEGVSIAVELSYPGGRVNNFNTYKKKKYSSYNPSLFFFVPKEKK